MKDIEWEIEGVLALERRIEQLVMPAADIIALGTEARRALERPTLLREIWKETELLASPSKQLQGILAENMALLAGPPKQLQDILAENMALLAGPPKQLQGILAENMALLAGPPKQLQDILAEEMALLAGPPKQLSGYLG